MRCVEISLNEEYNLKGGRLVCILGDCPLDGEHPEWKRPAVLAIPGGDYWMCSKREGEPFASYFLSKGFQTFILTYLTAPDSVHYPEQLLEAACAVDYIRKHAEEFHVNLVPPGLFCILPVLNIGHAFLAGKPGQFLDVHGGYGLFRRRWEHPLWCRGPAPWGPLRICRKHAGKIQAERLATGKILVSSQFLL